MCNSVFAEECNASPALIFSLKFYLVIAGHGMFNFWALLSTALFLWYSAIESMSMAYVMTPIVCDLSLTVVEKGLIASGCYIGNEITFATKF